MDKPKRKTRSDKGCHVGHTLEELQAKIKPTQPIIDIYLDYEIIAEMANKYNNLSLEEANGTWEEILRDAAANHTAKQIINLLENNNQCYGEFGLKVSEEIRQALLNLVKEK